MYYNMNRKRISSSKYQILLFFCVLLIEVALIIIWGMSKFSFHLDEYLTYVLSNSSIGSHIVLQEGTTYSGNSAFLDYLAVQNGHRFDYSYVWLNQSQDVHPPLYYVCIHTVCSLFPGVFSKWFGIAVNIFFFILAAIVIYKMFQKIFNDNIIALLGLVAWGTSSGMLTMAVFIRMYMMMSFFVLAVLYIHLKMYSDEKLGWKFYVPLFLATLGGGLTHYYFAIFMAFTAVFYVISLVIRKRFRELVFYVITYALAILAAILIFPSLIDQIFFGYRGTQAFSAVGKNTELLRDLKFNLKFILNDTVGNRVVFAILIVAMIVLVIRCFATSGFRMGIKKIYGHPATAMLIIIIFYAILIAKVAPYVTDRYTAPIYGPVFIIVFTIIVGILKMVKMKPVIMYLIILAVTILMMAINWSNGIGYLFHEKEAGVRIAQENKDCDAIYVHDGNSWKMCTNLQELELYHSYTPVKENHLAQYAEGKDLNGDIIYILYSIDPQEVLAQIQKADPDITHLELLNKPSSAVCYAATYRLSDQ